ncbi:MAG TPA: hypothetical protein VE981_24510 [Planctomycetota bacterium]|nr:hypothetical protein [Planctomycetota bacterium]
MRTLAAATLTLFLSPAAHPPASAAQDEPAKMEWAFTESDRFDFVWSYNEQRKRDPGRGETTETHDKRDVTAELVWKAEGILDLTLKKVVWNYGTQDFEVTLTYLEGKKLEPQLKMKVATTAPGFAVSKGDADRMIEYMKTLTEGHFTIDTVTEKGRTNVLWNGASVRSTSSLSLLARIFTHPLLPSGPVRVAQLFKDPLDVTNLPVGLTEVKEVESKVAAISEKGYIAKGGVSIPVGKSSVSKRGTQTMTGNFTYSCEWNYSPQQYLQGAKEESKFTKKVQATGDDADFYKENFNHTITQVLAIKKKGAKDEKK